jgi:hypothetical protein
MQVGVLDASVHCTPCHRTFLEDGYTRPYIRGLVAVVRLRLSAPSASKAYGPTLGVTPAGADGLSPAPGWKHGFQTLKA